MNKEEKYQTLMKNIQYAIKENPKIRYLTLLSEVINFYKANFSYMDWIGFYLVDQKKGILYLGPYIGKDACEEIAFDKGVCGKCYREKESQLVSDVHALSYHIACSSSTCSELVIPILDKGECIAVLDIDSDAFSAFDEVDKTYGEKVCQLLSLQYKTSTIL